jgi:hypothetical protein
LQDGIEEGEDVDEAASLNDMDVIEVDSLGDMDDVEVKVSVDEDGGKKVDGDENDGDAMSKDLAVFCKISLKWLKM